MELDVRRLRLLREVALRGTIAAAAGALGFTPSAISQQLSALERETGTALLERTGRRVRLTEAGQLLVDRTEPVLVALDEARAALEESQTTVVGTLRVAAAGSLAGALVLPVVAALVRVYPRLRVTVVDYEPHDSLRELRLGGLDVVVSHEYDDDRRRPDAEVIRSDLFSEEMLVAAPVGRFARPVRLGELSAEVWAAEPAETACGRAVRNACRAAGFEPDVRYASTESSVILAAVAVAGAVALLPRLASGSPLAEVELLCVTDPSPRRHVFAARRRGDPVRPAARLLLDQLAIRAAELARDAASELGSQELRS